MARMQNTPKTIADANSLVGTVWGIGDDKREITRVENVKVSVYDHNTLMADIYWCKPGGKERSKPTPLTTFRTWLNKATKQE
ncbi:hypothetical protein M6C35_002006 [Vibrio metschnikovii]|nr:hypothetical protein [Vibrio metschnikovii]